MFLKDENGNFNPLTTIALDHPWFESLNYKSLNTEYCFTVASVDALGTYSEQTQPACQTLTPNIPEPPTELSINQTSPSVATISFKDNSYTETQWIVERQIQDTWSDFYTDNVTISLRKFPVTIQLSSLSPGTIYTFRVRASNSIGKSEPSNVVTITTVPATLSWSPPTADNVLIIYNASDSRSVRVKDYYLNNRPLINGANILPLYFTPLSPSSGDGEAVSQGIDYPEFKSKIFKPITDWLIANSNKQIRYIVLIWGMPSRVTGANTNTEDQYGYWGGGSVDYQISRSLQKIGQRSGVEYKGYATRFMPDYYSGTTALVTHIDMGTMEDTEKYIKKLNTVYGSMDNPGIVISGRNAGVGGSIYYIDRAVDPGKASPYDQATANAVSGKVMYKDLGQGNFANASNVLGYSTAGTWGYVSNKTWPINGDVKFSGNSGWYVMKTGESWNGSRAQVWGQSLFSYWFAPNAFGGTNYENTPVGAVAHVREPTTEFSSGPAGLNGPELFSLWDQGYLFAEAAWASRNTPWMIAIGDPLVANTGPTKTVVVQNILPTVSLTSPTNGVNLTTPATFTISASASDPDGSISKVEFYNGSTLLSTDTSSPYSYIWNNVPAGTYALTAKAYDNASLSTVSSVVNVTVTATPINRAPTVSAGNNQTITLPSSATLAGSGSDPDGQALTYSWSKVSGPGTVTFSNALIASPTASFGTAGTYVLRLTVSDGSLSATADVIIVVNSAPQLSSKFSNGSRVEVNNTSINVRAIPSITGNLLGTQLSGAIGTINGGSIYADGYFWWNVNWDGGVDGYSVEDYLTNYVATTKYTVSVQKTGTGSGTVTFGGVSCGTTCSVSVNDGTSLALTPTATAGSTFTGWSGGGCSGTGSCTVLVGTNVTVTANFNLTPVNGACGAADKNYTPTETFPAGAYCSLGTVSPTAPSNPTSATGSSWSCQGINGGTTASCRATRSTAPINGLCGTALNICTDGTLSDATDSNTEYLWSCTGSNGGSASSCSLPKPTYTLTVVKDGSGTITSSPSGISCGSRCTETFVIGSSVSLTADASSGYIFAGWSGACSGTGSCTLLMDSVKTVTATFTTTAPVDDTTGLVISSINTSNITTTSATISWTTNRNTDAQVLYGPNYTYDYTTTLNSSLTAAHSETLNGLQPNTIYHYKVVSRDATGAIVQSGDQTFITLREAETFIYIPPINTPIEISYYTPLIVSQNISTIDNNTSNNNTPNIPTTRKILLPRKITKNLELGDSGQEVLLLQRTLNLLGYPISNIGSQSIGQETATFDEKTKQALILYQKNYEQSGIQATGTLDNATIILLNKDIARLVADAEDEVNGTTANPNSNLVSKIAEYLGQTVDKILELIKMILGL